MEEDYALRAELPAPGGEIRRDSLFRMQAVDMEQIDGPVVETRHGLIERCTDKTRNVAGSLTLLEALNATNVTNVVFSSTCAVYGDVQSIPIREEADKHPLSPYGRTKLVVEHMLEDFRQAHGMRYVVLRYFNAAGADPDGELGEVHDPEPHVIPRALMAAAGVIRTFDILGNDYPTADGTAVRDYTHVADLADAHVGALHHLLNGGESDAFNLGVGRGYSVLEIIRSVERLTGRHLQTAFAPRRPGDPAEVVADPSRAKRVLRFEPAYPELDDMVRTAWRWFEANGFAASR